MWFKDCRNIKRWKGEKQWDRITGSGQCCVCWSLMFASSLCQSLVGQQSPWCRGEITSAIKGHKALNERKGVKAIDLGWLTDCRRDETCWARTVVQPEERRDAVFVSVCWVIFLCESLFCLVLPGSDTERFPQWMDFEASSFFCRWQSWKPRTFFFLLLAF